MKILITGACGQLGSDVMRAVLEHGHICIGSYHSKKASDSLTVSDKPCEEKMTYVRLDITDRDTVTEIIGKYRPDAIIHCASWTEVDAAEDEENRETVRKINSDGTRFIAEAARNIDAKMLYISTDYVFSGQGERPWEPDDECLNPLSVYAKSKRDGELAVSKILEKYFIVRTAWAFGSHGKNFVNTMIRIGKTHDMVRVVNDQIGTPTYTSDLSRLIVDMIESEKYGYYHATNSEEYPGGYISWYDFCCEIYRQYGIDTNVIPVSTAEYGMNKAIRPHNSRLDKSKLAKMGFTPLPTWKDALARYLKETKL